MKPQASQFHNSAYKSIFQKPEEEPDSPRVVAPKREIAFEIDTLGESLDRLDEMITELRTQLFPVMTAEPDEKQEPPDHITRRTDLGQRLYEYTVEVDKETDRLIDILQRLQL